MRSFYLALALLALPSQQLLAQKNKVYGQEYIEAIADNTRLYVSKRPDVKDRLFRSKVIDKKIEEVKKLLKGNRYLDVRKLFPKHARNNGSLPKA